MSLVMQNREDNFSTGIQSKLLSPGDELLFVSEVVVNNLFTALLAWQTIPSVCGNILSSLQMSLGDTLLQILPKEELLNFDVRKCYSTADGASPMFTTYRSSFAEVSHQAFPFVPMIAVIVPVHAGFVAGNDVVGVAEPSLDDFVYFVAKRLLHTREQITSRWKLQASMSFL